VTVAISPRFGGAIALLIGLTSAVTLVAAVLLVAADGGRVPGDPVAALAQTARVSPAAPASAAPSATLLSRPPAAHVLRPDRTWVKRTARLTGIGPVALSAYGSAELRLGVERPACHLSWATLAGIGYIESQHGTIGGRVLGVDGRPWPRPIFGVHLTGAGPVARIADTDGGRIDGDDRYDRAVGPMQFVPSTWRVWESDGNGDGVADPQDIEDAAYAAGRYLCASGLPLSAGAGWTRAVLSYNDSPIYLRDVLAATNAYASRSTG
jgi:membrane-bound lytic murein transglycosylase B